MGEKCRSRTKWVLVAVLTACVLAAVVALVLKTNSDAGRNRQRAIELVQEYLEEYGSVYDSVTFETWEADGDSSTMMVSATYYPHDEDGGEAAHSGDVAHIMKWQVHLNNGRVIPFETVHPDG